jgi:TRAP-type C4-dicarboxylate transport system permease small subunit
MANSRLTEAGTWLKMISRLNSVVAVLFFAGLTLVVTLQVLTRFVFHAPFIWSEEAARFLFFWVVMLGAAMSVRTRRHFVVDITSGHAARWGRAGRFLFDIIPGICILAFSAFLLVQGIGYARVGLLRTATNLQISMSLVYAAIPAFALLSVLYSAANLVQDLAAFVQGRAAAPRPPSVSE